jgi:hypothetical protein
VESMTMSARSSSPSRFASSDALIFAPDPRGASLSTQLVVASVARTADSDAEQLTRSTEEWMEAAEIQAWDGDAHSVNEFRGALVAAAKDLGPVIRVPSASAGSGARRCGQGRVEPAPSGAYATYMRSPALLRCASDLRDDRQDPARCGARWVHAVGPVRPRRQRYRAPTSTCSPVDPFTATAPTHTYVRRA